MNKRPLAVAITGTVLLAVLISCSSSKPSEPPPFVSPLSPPTWIIGEWSADSTTWVFTSDNALYIYPSGDTLDHKELSKDITYEVSDDSSSTAYAIQTISIYDTCASTFGRTSDTTLNLMVGCSVGGYYPAPVHYTKQ